ncbi:MAG: hypothetical protein IJX99_02995 [Clostridia bacterium]|nr:hypothetical protein [Clostridia bacterium]
MSKFENAGYCPYNSGAYVLYNNPNVSELKKARFASLWSLIGPYWVFDKDDTEECCAPNQTEFSKMLFGENMFLSETILTGVIKHYDFAKEQKIRVRQPMQHGGHQNLADMVMYIQKAKNAQVIASGCNQVLYDNFGAGHGDGAGNVQQSFTVILSDGDVEGELILAYWSTFNSLLSFPVWDKQTDAK